MGKGKAGARMAPRAYGLASAWVLLAAVSAYGVVMAPDGASVPRYAPALAWMALVVLGMGVHPVLSVWRLQDAGRSGWLFAAGVAAATLGGGMSDQVWVGFGLYVLLVLALSRLPSVRRGRAVHPPGSPEAQWEALAQRLAKADKRFPEGKGRVKRLAKQLRRVQRLGRVQDRRLVGLDMENLIQSVEDLARLRTLPHGPEQVAPVVASVLALVGDMEDRVRAEAARHARDLAIHSAVAARADR